MIIYGAGGHAKVLIEIAIACHLTVEGIFDDHATGDCMGFPVLGKYQVKEFSDSPVVVGIGDNHIRQKISHLITHPFGTLIHPLAYCSPSSSIGEGSVVMVNSVVNTNSIVGKHCIINTSAVVDHDCIIGNFVHIAPNATLCGHVKVGQNTLIGAGVQVTPNVTIGANCKIQAGAIVHQDVPDNTVFKN